MLSSVHSWSSFAHDTGLHHAISRTLLPGFLDRSRWFAGKSRSRSAHAISQVTALPAGPLPYFFTTLAVSYPDSSQPEHYLLPLAFLPGLTPARWPYENATGLLGELTLAGQGGLLVDALYEAGFRQRLFTGMGTQEHLRSEQGAVWFTRGRALSDEPLTSQVLAVDSSNTAVTFGDRYFFKLYRKMFDETNPEVEVVQFLTQHSDFRHLPAFAGSISYEGTDEAKGRTCQQTYGMMQQLVSSRQDTWTQTGDFLDAFLTAFADGVFAIEEAVFEQVEKLAQRTAEMHLGLFTTNPAHEAFVAEPFTDDYRRFLHRRLSHLLSNRYALLHNCLPQLDPQARQLANDFFASETKIRQFIDDFLNRPLHSLRTRIHGDYHLGQVLTDAGDYIIIDYEGEPESSIADRKVKHSPLKDVAGMVRSYHYAVSARLCNAAEAGQPGPERLQQAAQRWYRLMRGTFLEAYRHRISQPHVLFAGDTEFNYLLTLYLLEKAVYELGYELSYRPGWVNIPLRGIADAVAEMKKLQRA